MTESERTKLEELIRTFSDEDLRARCNSVEPGDEADLLAGECERRGIDL